jgi:MarR-like DNA-binding transcriptional regulator SgrR of sgrS sRNA
MKRVTMSAAWLVAIASVWPGSSAHGALPPRHGGRLVLPAPEAIGTLDPVRARSPFEATLARAVFDGLYELGPSGEIRPVLAAGPPELVGTTATVRLRPAAHHHGVAELTAEHVVRSLARVSSARESSWLLGGIATENGRLAVRAVDPRTVQIQLARPGVRIDQLLAAAPLAIVAGGNLGQRPLGTGPFRARLDGRGGVELTAFVRAPDGAPWLEAVRFAGPQAREEEVRAFELGRLDGSWWARSLYGGEPVRPVSTASAPSAAPILLVPNRARTLRDDALWAGLAAVLDRQRLEHVGLAPQRSLGEGLPAPDVPSRGVLTRGLTLRMLMRGGHPLEARLAEALAGMLDERGVRLVVERASPDAYDAAVDGGGWDLRLARVRAPLPGRGPLVGAALAAAGQTDRARRVAAALDDAELAATEARTLGALVLGHERVVLHHRADLTGVELDATGRLRLADVSFARAEEPGGAR